MLGSVTKYFSGGCVMKTKYHLWGRATQNHSYGEVHQNVNIFPTFTKTILRGNILYAYAISCDSLLNVCLSYGEYHENKPYS